MFVFRTIIWGTIFILAVLAAGPWLAMRLDASFPPMALGPFRYIGIPLMLVGIPLAIYCVGLLFWPGESRAAPYDAGGDFRVTGFYRHVRNPFMLGVIVALWGEVLITSSWAMLAYAALAIWCIHFWVVFYEEPTLLERFGDEYKEYKESVPRWIPSFSAKD